MDHISSIPAMQELSRSWQLQGHSIGLVPTMGYLHEGHLSLIRAAKTNGAKKVIVSIFVNPTQFGPKEDLAKYPRDLKKDTMLCEQEGADVIFCPTPEEMYPQGYSTWVLEEQLSGPLCGASRPGHFRGVTTVVTKLFLACLPDLAVFGQKDAQQALVLQRMARDLNFPIKLVIAPIVREPDGLAMSSRNVYLTPDERLRALSIRRGLDQAEQAFAKKERQASSLIALVQACIESHGGIVDYIEVRDLNSLDFQQEITTPCLLAVAAAFGKARLLDNIVLHP